MTKKLLSFVLLLGLCLCLASCSDTKKPAAAAPDESIAPCTLSEDAQELLDLLALSDRTRLFSFHAPEEAITLRLQVSLLNADGEWEPYDGGSVSIGADRATADVLSGTLALRLCEDNSFAFTISSNGKYGSERVSFQTSAFTPDTVQERSTLFLHFQQRVTLNEAIPLALLLQGSGEAMQVSSPEAYHDPAQLQGLDYALAVTVTFTDQEV